MGTKNLVKVRKAEERDLLPATDLVIVPYNGRDLMVRSFGPNPYGSNRVEMSKHYWHSSELPNINFRPATTQESIGIARTGFGEEGEYDARRDIFNPRWLQAGLIVRTADGVWTNTQETDETSLKALLNGIKKVNGVYLLNNGSGFAPYESFKTGVQDNDTFAQGGLARVLEHTQEPTAEILRAISSPGFYPEGINVWGFDSVKKPVVKVASLGSGGGLGDGGLYVDGDYWVDDGGCAFGVLDSGKSE